MTEYFTNIMLVWNQYFRDGRTGKVSSRGDLWHSWARLDNKRARIGKVSPRGDRGTVGRLGNERTRSAREATCGTVGRDWITKGQGLARSAREATVAQSGDWETKGQGQLERRPVEQSGETGKQKDRVSSRGDLWNNSRGDLWNSLANGKNARLWQQRVGRLVPCSREKDVGATTSAREVAG